KHAASVDSQYELSLHDDTQPQDVIREVVAAMPVTSIAVRRPTLEDVFVAIVQGDAASADDEARLRAELRGGPTQDTPEATS
ncbi:MAG: DUF4162 domain-containing protein, partial [Planctomycetota bacterium]